MMSNHSQSSAEPRVRRLAPLAMIAMFCWLACSQKTPRVAEQPDTVLYDVNCSSNPPERNTRVANRRACTEKDREDVEAVDSLYEQFVWDTFIWINQGTRWKGWPSMRVSVAATCQPRNVEQAEDLASWTDLLPGDTPPGSAPPLPNPIWDQNGNPVRFEVRYYSPAQQFRDRWPALLRSVKSQVNNSCRGHLISSWGFHPFKDEQGLPEQGQHISLRLKLAWKQLSPEEQRRSHLFIVDDPEAPERGVVAMHVAIKSESTSLWWTWATFSHVSNVTRRHELGPLFFDPQCPECPANQCPRCDNGCRTQVQRLHGIAPRVQEINREYQRKLSGSPLRYYELVGVQRMPQAVEQIPRDREPMKTPRPELLASEIIEWDRQDDSSCIGCHVESKSWAYDSESDCDDCGVCLQAYTGELGALLCKCSEDKARSARISLIKQPFVPGQFLVEDMFGLLMRAAWNAPDNE